MKPVVGTKGAGATGASAVFVSSGATFAANSLVVFLAIIYTHSFCDIEPAVDQRGTCGISLQLVGLCYSRCFHLIGQK